MSDPQRPKITIDLSRPRIYVDFLNADDEGRLKLNLDGTRRDLAAHRVELRQGLKLLLWSDDADATGAADDLLAEGTVEFDRDTGKWVVRIDADAIRNESELRP